MWLAVAAALTMVVAACGGSTAASGSGEPLTLNVTNIGTDLSTLPMFVAESRGLFAQQNLKVNFSTATNTNQPALLSSGQTDLVFNSNGVAITAALRGQPAESVYGLVGYSYTVELWGGSEMKSMQQLQQASSCRFATLPPGGATYGYAKYWTEKFGLKCEIVVASGIDAILSGIRAGTFDVGLIPRSGVGTVPDGINILIPKTAPGDPSYPQVPGGDKAESAGLLGLPANLDAKRPAVTAFIKGMVEAQKIIDSTPSDQLVPDVQKIQLFAAVPATQLQQQIDNAKTAVWKDPANGRAGYVPEETWKNSLQAYSYWGIQGFDPANPAVSYQKMINMSFYDDAAKS